MKKNKMKNKEREIRKESDLRFKYEKSPTECWAFLLSTLN